MVERRLTTQPILGVPAVEELFSLTGAPNEVVVLDVAAMVPLEVVALEGAPLLSGPTGYTYNQATRELTIHAAHAAGADNLRVLYRPRGAGGAPGSRAKNYHVALVTDEARRIDAAPLASRKTIAIQGKLSNGAATAWVGFNDQVSPSGSNGGWEVPKGRSIILALEAGQEVWGVMSGGPGVVCVVEVA